MKTNKIFGVSEEEIDRQCAAASYDHDHDMPIKRFDTMEPVIEGGKKILDDPRLCKLMHDIYRNTPET